MKLNFIPVLALLWLASPQLPGSTAWPDLLNYQGQLTDLVGNPVPDGSYNVTFSLYTAPGGITLAFWSETQIVSASKGLFNVILGSVVPLSGLLLANSANDMWIGIKVGADAEMTPQQQLLPAVYATHARNAATLGGNPIGTSAFNVVQLNASGKIAAGLVSGSNLLPLDLSGDGGAYNLNIDNSSTLPSAYGLITRGSGGISATSMDAAGFAVHAQSLNTNYFSDASDKPLYGFFHNDISPNPAAIGIYSRSSCSDCSAGYFYNTSGTAGSGGALYVHGRMNMPVASGTFSTGNNVSSYTFFNSYIRTAANTTIILTPLSNIGPSWWISSIGASANQAVVSFSSNVSNESFQYIILGK